MEARRWIAPAYALAAVLVLTGCGGGGGDAGPVAQDVRIDSIEVETQPSGPDSHFGTTVGGDRVVLRGAGFVFGLTLAFDGVEATIEDVVSTHVTAITPRHAAGFVRLSLRNPGGAGAFLDGVFQYIAPPEVSAIEVLTGPTAGGQTVPIAGDETLQLVGRNFRDGMRISVGGRDVPTTFVDSETARATAPTMTVGSRATVSVVNPEGLTATLRDGVVYTQEFSLDLQPNALSRRLGSHLLRRVAFGDTPEVIEQATRDGLIVTVNTKLNYVNDPAVEAAALTIYGADAPPKPNINTRTNKEWWLHLMLKNPNPLQERLAFFLHDHFATSEAGFPADSRWFMYRQVNLFRRFSLTPDQTLADGSAGIGYRWDRILIEVCKDRAMLNWLDGRVSTRAAPNENFARELWELFMLGEGNGYTEDDIQNAAKAFTGFFWFYSGGRGTDSPLEMRYRPSRHDEREKTIFGETGFFGYDDLAPFYETATGGRDPANGTTDPSVTTDPRDTDGGMVALTLRKRPVEASRFICRKLVEYFLFENPHEELIVEELAKQLRTPGGNQWNLKPILLRLFRSKAMFSQRAIKGKVKNPVEYVLSFLRSTGIDVNANLATNASQVRQSLIEIGQVVLDPPDVNGWPSGSAWMSSQAMLERFNFLNFVVTRIDPGLVDLELLLPPEGQRGPAQLVDHIASILDVKLTSNARLKCIQYVQTEIVGGTTVPFAFDPTNPQHLEMKVRGLLYQIGQYYDAHRD